MTMWSILLSGTTRSSRTSETCSPAKAVVTRRSRSSIRALKHFLSFSALRAAAILAALAGQPIPEQICQAVGNKMRKVRAHIQKVESESHYWKERYRGETGSLRGRIRELEAQLRAERTSDDS